MLGAVSVFQSLDNLPPRAILDANVLLNACFVEGSAAREAVKGLPGLGFSVVVDEATEAEALRILNERRRSLGLNFDPVGMFRSFLLAMRIVVVGPGGLGAPARVNRADRHVYAAARHHEAWVVTADLPFMHQCQSEDQPARTPIDVACAAMRSSDESWHRYLMRSAGLARESGSVFGRLEPGAWAGSMANGTFTACEVENVFRLSFSATSEQWELEMFDGSRAGVLVPVRRDRISTVSASYKRSATSDRFSVTLRAHTQDGIRGEASITARGQLRGDGPGRISLGHTSLGEHHWGGWLRSMIVAPTPLASKSWKALVACPDSAPDPSSANLLNAALRTLHLRLPGIALPTEDELSKSWI